MQFKRRTILKIVSSFATPILILVIGICKFEEKAVTTGKSATKWKINKFAIQMGKGNQCYEEN